MIVSPDTSKPSPATLRKPSQRYRLPGIAREGIAQLSLLETALWPLQGGQKAAHQFDTEYEYGTNAGRMTAHVTVRAPLGWQAFDELVLWGLLGATLNRPDAEPVLLSTPYWMLRHLGLETGGSQYVALRESLVRLAVASYQNDGFYNPQSKERESATFQFLSLLLPTVGGVGKTVDNERCWRIEWNPVFFRFCQATGGTLLFDLELFRQLSPASRRLFLKLKDRFWRGSRIFLNVNDLTIHGLGFSAARPLANRKFDLLNCIRELLDHRVIELGRGQTNPKQLLMKRGKGSYVVTFYEGDYFREKPVERTTAPKIAIANDPLYEPLRQIGVDGPAIARLFKTSNRGRIQKWLRITDAALHEGPRGFTGFRVSPAAFLIDGIQKNRPLPDWSFAHEKVQETRQWKQYRDCAASEPTPDRSAYDQARVVALQEYLNNPEGRQKYEQYFTPLLVLHKLTSPEAPHEAARTAARNRVETMDFRFPEYEEWVALGKASPTVN